MLRIEISFRIHFNNIDCICEVQLAVISNGQYFKGNFILDGNVPKSVEVFKNDLD